MGTASKYVQKFYELDVAAAEYRPEKFFDAVLNGKRTRQQSYKGGKVTIIIKFTNRIKYNCHYSWGGERDIFKNDVELQLYNAAEDVLYHNGKAPSKDGKLVGGDIQPGDTIIYEFGNFVVENLLTVDDYKINQKMQIFLPFKYTRKAGGQE